MYHACRSDCPCKPPLKTSDTPPQFTPLISDRENAGHPGATLEGMRYLRPTPGAPLAATVMMGGILEGLSAKIQLPETWHPLHRYFAGTERQSGENAGPEGMGR